MRWRFIHWLLLAAQMAAGGRQARANAFNPAISVVLQGAANSYSQKPDDYALPGFQLGEEGDLPAGAVIVWLLALSGITVSLASRNSSGRQS